MSRSNSSDLEKALQEIERLREELQEFKRTYSEDLNRIQESLNVVAIHSSETLRGEGKSAKSPSNRKTLTIVAFLLPFVGLILGFIIYLSVANKAQPSQEQGVMLPSRSVES